MRYLSFVNKSDFDQSFLSFSIIFPFLWQSRHELLETLWQLASEGDHLTREAFMNVTKEKLSAFSKELVDATSAGINTEEESMKKWTFWGGVFYSLTVYTTIGECREINRKDFNKLNQNSKRNYISLLG